MSDDIDLGRLHARDPELLTGLVMDLSPRIWMAIRRYARDDDHANDLVQDCWLQILKRLDSYNQRGSFAGWAIAVSRNVCRMRLRGAPRAKHISLDEIGEVPDAASGLEGASRTLRQREILFAAMDRLRARERDALVLKVLEGRPTRDVAEALGVREDTARSLVHRGLQSLRRMKQVRGLLVEWMGVE